MCVFFSINEKLQIKDCLGGDSCGVVSDGVKRFLLLHAYKQFNIPPILVKRHRYIQHSAYVFHNILKSKLVSGETKKCQI